MHSLKASREHRQDPQTTQTLLHPQAALIKQNFYLFFPSDPNTGYSDVPVTWVPYTTEGGYYLDINNNLNYDSVKQNLRAPFVNYWNAVYLKLPQVATTP